MKLFLRLTAMTLLACSIAGTVRGQALSDYSVVQAPYVLMDSQGTIIGKASDFADPVVVFTTGTSFFQLKFWPDQVMGAPNYLVYFTDTQCATAPLLEKRGDTGFVIQSSVLGSTLYLEDPDAVVQTLTIRSQMDRSGVCLVESPPFARGMTFARSMPHFTDRFHPPFTVKSSVLPPGVSTRPYPGVLTSPAAPLGARWR